ncbi:hypothetical protein AHAS_Ahas11G0246600 [Arachis hypogaea]
MTMSLNYLSSSVDPMNLDNNFFSEPMFSNRFSFHMSGNGDIARCTDSLDVRSKLSANLDSGKEGMKHSSKERRALGVVVELGLENVVDVVGVGGDVIEDVKVDASGG